MLSVIEMSIAGDTFLFCNDLSSQELEQLKVLSEQFRKRGNLLVYSRTSAAVEMFCAEVEERLGIQLHPVAVAAVITLK